MKKTEKSINICVQLSVEQFVQNLLNLNFFFENNSYLNGFKIAGSILPQRVVMGIMGTLAIAVAYTVRTCISVAIVEMVIPINHTAYTGKGEEFRSSVCMTIKWLKILIIISTFL